MDLPTFRNLRLFVNQQNNVDILHLTSRHAPMETDQKPATAIPKLRQRSLVLEVRDALEGMILRGEVPAGERLNEISLAERMGVSRGPVREAARSLEREGLVKTIANQGVFVRKLSIEDALELYDLRAGIAGYLCARAAEVATDRDKSDLRDFVHRMEAAAQAGDDTRYFELNLAFHDRVAVASGASRSRELYASLGKEVRLLRLRVLTGGESLTRSNSEHDRIVTAIEDGDRAVAEKEGSEHHINGKFRLMATL